MKRYHPALVALHWILAIAVLLLLFGGSQLLAPLPSDDPQKLMGMKGHIILANLAFALMTLRLIVRLKTKKPEDADTGFALLNKAAKMAHYFLYLMVFAMVASGWAMVITAGLTDSLLDNPGASIPEDLTVYPARVAHGVFATILAVLILGHFLAALYHQFVRKDHLFSRMWFGNRGGD